MNYKYFVKTWFYQWCPLWVEFLVLIESSLSVFSFTASVWVFIEKILHDSSQKDIIFFSGNFIDKIFVLRSVICLEIIFCLWSERRVKIQFYVPATLNETFPSQSDWLQHFVENQSTICVWFYLYTFCFVPLVCLSRFQQCHTFLILELYRNLEIGWC